MILAVSVCTRSGKVLLSRAFESLSAEKMQELFGNFSKLSQQGVQHTTFEADGMRYIYEPLEDLFVVVVTDLSSNILQDIRTLHLVSQCIGAQVHTPTETEISDSAFEIICALDEVVNNGYAENLSPQQVETFLEMESHAEKIQEIIERNKEIEAAEERKRRARDLEDMRKGRSQTGFGGSSSDYIDSRAPPSFSGAGSSTPTLMTSSTPVETPKPTFGRGGGSGAPKGRGLQLGKKKEETAAPLLPHLPQASTPQYSTKSSSAAAVATPAAPEGVEISIQEALTIEATRNGDIRNARVAGSLHLFAGDRENACLRIKTKTMGPANAYKTNPKMDRALFSSERTLALRNAQESFPASNVLLLKWTVDNIKAPIQFSVWVSQSPDAGFLSVTVEYELSEDFVDTLENVNVKVPLPHPNAHVVDPSSVYDQEDGHIIWMIPVVNSANPSGTFDFTAEADSEELFFPLEATLTTKGSTSTFGQIQVEAVENPATGASVPYTTQVVAEAESYIIR